MPCSLDRNGIFVWDTLDGFVLSVRKTAKQVKQELITRIEVKKELIQIYTIPGIHRVGPLVINQAEEMMVNALPNRHNSQQNL